MQRILRAEIGDLDDAAPLFDDYRRFFTKRADLAVSRSFLEERLRNGECVLFLCREDGLAIGFLQLYPLFSSWYAKRIWFLSDLYVADDARKKGAGRALVRAALDFATQTGAASIMVELPFSEPHLARFYGELGFDKDPVFELYRCAIGGTSAESR